MAYRWFLGFGFHTEVTHFSTFGKNYVRRLAETDLIEHIFYTILNEVANRGLLSPNHVFIDSTHVKASANKRKFEKKIVRKETRAYEKRLQEELNLDREEHGKKPFPPEKFEVKEYKEIKESSLRESPVDCSAGRRLLRDQRSVKTPQEKPLRRTALRPKAKRWEHIRGG